MTRVVKELVLRTSLIWRTFVLTHAIHDSTVAARADLPFHAQLEAAELVLRDNIATLGAWLVRKDQLAIFDLPAIRQRLPSVLPPAVRRLAIEEELPAVPLFLLGEDVDALASVVGPDGAGQDRHDTATQ